MLLYLISAVVRLLLLIKKKTRLTHLVNMNMLSKQESMLLFNWYVRQNLKHFNYALTDE